MLHRGRCWCWCCRLRRAVDVVAISSKAGQEQRGLVIEEFVKCGWASEAKLRVSRTGLSIWGALRLNVVRALNAVGPAQACAVGTQAVAVRYAAQPPGVLCPPAHASAQLRHCLAQTLARYRAIASCCTCCGLRGCRWVGSKATPPARIAAATCAAHGAQGLSPAGLSAASSRLASSTD